MHSSSRSLLRPALQSACAIVLLAASSGCGQTGPLYMPDPKADMIEVRRPGGSKNTSNPEKKPAEAQPSIPSTATPLPEENSSDEE